MAATGTERSPETKPGSTAFSTRRVAIAFSSSGRARMVEAMIRARLNISARRSSSVFAPAPTPITHDPPAHRQRLEVAREVGGADQLEDDVERASFDELVGRDRVHAERGDLLAAVLVAYRRRDARAGHRAELHGGRPDAARRAVDEQSLADDQARLGEEGVVSGEEDLGRAAGRDPVQLVRDRHRDPLVDHRQLGLAAAGDDRHHAVARLEALDAVAGLDHLARQLEPGDVLRRAGRRRIAAGELHHVGAVEPRGVHADQQLAGLRARVRMLFDGDLAVANRRGSHRARCYRPAKPARMAVADVRLKG